MNKLTYIYIFLFLGCFINVYRTNAQEISLFQQFNGHYDYTALGNTMNTLENGPLGACTINTSSSANLSLNSNQTLVAAYLYWAGSDNGDFDIELNGIPITAERTFSDALSGNRTFFAAFADVTAIVSAQGNGTYTVSELDLTSVISSYCPTGTNFAGWAITVIYENPLLPLNQLNVYDGLESVPDELEITLDNLNVFDNMGAKIGFVAWEGDKGLSVNESLRINGSIISNFPLNPANNAFNGTNSFTGASNLYNMDIDVYNIQNYIAIGDTQATISLTSGQDFVMVNNIITVLNSKLPDATVTIDNIVSVCDSRELTINYTIYNTNSTAILPQNTPISFYADGILVASAFTPTALPIGGNVQQTMMVTIPASISNSFDFTIVVDDNGTGTSTVDEINEDNNVALENIVLPTSPEIPQLFNLEICDNENDLSFNLTLQENFFTNSVVTFQYYETFDDASNMFNPIINTTTYTNNSYPTTIYMKVTNSVTLCSTITEFDLELLESPLANQPSDLVACLLDTSEIATFDLTTNASIINNHSNTTIRYFETLASNGSFEDEIINPEAYNNITNPQTIHVRVESPNGCASNTTFNLIISDCEIYIPNGLSPNGDGKNDVFNILNLEAHPNHKLHIYNRFGTLIFIGDKNTGHWNGVANRGIPKNKQLPAGTYFYVLYLNDTNIAGIPTLPKQTYTGWVYLQNN